MFHVHVRILMENAFWMSAIDNDLNTCKIFIAVTAKLTFSNTRGVDEVPPPHPESPTPPPPPLPKVNRRQSRTSQNAGWFSNKEFNQLFDPHYKKVQDTPSLPTHPPSKPHKPKGPKEKPTKGLQVKSYNLKKYVPRKQDFKCPASTRCKDIYESQALINLHVKGKHPNYHWQCSYCPKRYSTYNAAYKHERNHAAPTHICYTCQKAFHYKSRVGRTY